MYRGLLSKIFHAKPLTMMDHEINRNRLNIFPVHKARKGVYPTYSESHRDQKGRIGDLVITTYYRFYFMICQVKNIAWRKKMKKKKIMNIGVDLHKVQMTNCFYVNEEKNKTKEYALTESAYQNFIADLKMLKEKKYFIKLAVETTGNSEYFINQIKSYVDSWIVINTKQAKDLIKSHKKTDKNDAYTIAFLLSKDIFVKKYTVQFSSEKSKELRRMLHSRNILVKSRTGLKNQIHGILLGRGEETKKRFLNSKKGRENLKNMNYPEQCLLNALIESLELLNVEIEKFENLIEKKVQEFSDMYRIITSAPGFGLLSAAALIAGIDDIKRFETKEQLSSYCGLVPYVNNSGDKVSHGRITKDGPNYMRVALVQGVLAMMRSKNMKHNPIIKRYQKIKNAKCAGKAIIATARKMLTIFWTLLQRNEEFDVCYRTDRKKLEQMA